MFFHVSIRGGKRGIHGLIYMFGSDGVSAQQDEVLIIVGGHGSDEVRMT